jgi:hypothetical protein
MDSPFSLLPDAAFLRIAAGSGLRLRDLSNLAAASYSASLGLAELGSAAFTTSAAAHSIHRFWRLWGFRRSQFRAKEASWLRDRMAEAALHNQSDEDQPWDLASLMAFGCEGAGKLPDEVEVMRLRMAIAATYDTDITMEASDVRSICSELPGMHSAKFGATLGWLFRTLDCGRHGRDGLPNMVVLVLDLSNYWGRDPSFRGHPTMFDSLREGLLTPECIDDVKGWADDADAGCPLEDVAYTAEMFDKERVIENSRVIGRVATGILAALHAAWTKADMAGWRKFEELCGEHDLDLRGRVVAHLIKCDAKP